MRFRIILFFSLITTISFTQKVETVVASGFDITTNSVFSKNNKYLALASSQYVAIFDVKSGRMLRRLDMPKGLMLEKIEFKKDQLLFYVYSQNKILNIDIASGEIKESERESWDLSTYDYMIIQNQDWLKASTHFHTNKSNKPYDFTSGDNKIRYGVASRDKGILKYSLEIIDKGKSKTLVKSSQMIVFMNACFSENGRYAYASGYIYDFKTHSIIAELKGVPYSGMSADFKPTTNIPVVLSQFGLFTEWNMPQINKWEVSGAVEMSFNNTKTEIKHYDLDKKSYGYSTTDYGIPKKKPEVELGQSYFHAFSENNKYLLTRHLMEPNKWQVVEMASAKVLKEFEVTDYKTSMGWVGNKLWVNEGASVKHYSLPDFKETSVELSGYSIIQDQYVSNPFYDNGIMLKFDYLNYKTGVWDLETGSLVSSFDMPKGETYFGWKMKVDKKSMKAYVLKENDVLEYDLKTGKILHKYMGHTATVLQVEFSDDRSQIISSSSDGTARIWDVSTGKELLSIIVVGKEDFILKTPDNYYLSTRDATDYIHFVKGKDIYLFEQFDLKYNRPDIVLSKLCYVDQNLIKAYKKAYLKRLKKMNFTEDMLKGDFHLPKIKIKKFEYLPVITDSARIELNLHIIDEKYPLDRVNVWINDVAIYGSKGISIRDKNIKELDKTIQFDLARGDNKVQVSVLNQAGAESYKETFNVKCNEGKEKSDLYLITIGESKFKAPKFNLTYASKDAMDMVNLFKGSKQFGEIHTKILVNEQTTKENIVALKKFVANAGRNDQVLVFMAGHGVLNEDLDYFLATYDMDFENPSEKGLPYEELEAILDGIQPLKKTLILDACHSGEIDKDEVELVAATEPESEDITFRAVGNAATPKLGSENVSSLTQSLFADLRRGTGATVISSAGGVEFAMESDEWKNGLFTYCFINGIKSGKADLNEDGEIWLSELQKFVQDEVMKKSNGQQQPTTRKINLSLDYRIW